MWINNLFVIVKQPKCNLTICSWDLNGKKKSDYHFWPVEGARFTLSAISNHSVISFLFLSFFLTILAIKKCSNPPPKQSLFIWLKTCLAYLDCLCELCCSECNIGDFQLSTQWALCISKLIVFCTSFHLYYCSLTAEGHEPHLPVKAASNAVSISHMSSAVQFKKVRRCPCLFFTSVIQHTEALYGYK